MFPQRFRHLMFALVLMGLGAVACNRSQSQALGTNEGQAPTAQTPKDMVEVAPAASARYTYETVPGDPMGVKMYTLKNGMKLYMSVNKAEPRIFTNIAVRAGSKYDPATATGLAHYLEHMMFKGTSRIGSLDWEKESEMLQYIARLYETHRNTSDPEARKALYAQIDSVSNEAAKLVAANEYDKMMSSLGAKATNAYTWVEQTVYVNDIPANELEKWMALESERFREVVLRLFHTELEAVYEEFNINQDRDGRKVMQQMSEALFPSHPYGTQTTIGTGEHLKSPSHYEIYNYFSKYYKPNNMAIVVAGDFDPDEMVALAERYFGDYSEEPIERPSFEPQPELSGRIVREVMGQESPYTTLAWRFNGANSGDAPMLMLIGQILYNGKAGLLDLNVNQQQLLLQSYAYPLVMEDYAMFQMQGRPREGQSLEEVENILMAELGKLARGEFDDWLLDACIKDMKLRDLRAAESNNARVSEMTDAFIWGLDWADYTQRYERLQAITKADIMAFAQQRLRADNYVVVFKRSGTDPNVPKVEKPSITPVSLNREQPSAFYGDFSQRQSEALEPAFLDFQALIQQGSLASGLPFHYVKNEQNPTFSLYYILDMGKNNDRILPIAISYLPYLGTDQYSAEALQQEFFKLGLSFDVFSSNDRTYVTLSGLDESFAQGVSLFEHILSNAQPNDEALANVVADILQQRENSKKNKNVILRSAMGNFARHGKLSPFTDNLSEQDLKALTAEELLGRIKGLSSYEHTVFYYGSQEAEAVQSVLDKYHRPPTKRKPVPAATDYPELPTSGKKVYFVEFPMVQAEVLMLSKGNEGFRIEEAVMAELYNTYFGRGLSSIMFQEIRESRALAYSTYAYYTSPGEANKAHYMQVYVGTQANKLQDALAAVQDIVQNMPVAEQQIENARQSVIKQIQTERINGSSIYWTWVDNLRKGYKGDMRQAVYAAMQGAEPSSLVTFQDEYVKNRDYTIMVLGSRESIGEANMAYLESLGQIEYLSLEDIFGY